jgi:predicted RNase H-like nuclease (RuvC/YqgF family)
MSISKALKYGGGTFDESNNAVKKYRERAKRYKQQVKNLKDQLINEKLNSATLSERFEELKEKKKTQEKLV